MTDDGADPLGDLLKEPTRLAHMLRLLTVPHMRALLQDELLKLSGIVRFAREQHGTEPLPDPFQLMTGISACIELGLLVANDGAAARLAPALEAIQALLRQQGVRPPGTN